MTSSSALTCGCRGAGTSTALVSAGSVRARRCGSSWRRRTSRPWPSTCRWPNSARRASSPAIRRWPRSVRTCWTRASTRTRRCGGSGRARCFPSRTRSWISERWPASATCSRARCASPSGCTRSRGSRRWTTRRCSGWSESARRFLGMNVLESSGGGMVTYPGAAGGRLAGTTRRPASGSTGGPAKPVGCAASRIVLERRGPQARSTYFCPKCQPRFARCLAPRWCDSCFVVSAGRGGIHLGATTPDV